MSVLLTAHNSTIILLINFVQPIMWDVVGQIFFKCVIWAPKVVNNYFPFSLFLWKEKYKWILSSLCIYFRTCPLYFRLGLWSHCFRSLPDPLDQYQRRFFVGCRWVYDPFTTGYDKIRGYLLPGRVFIIDII